VSAVLVVDIGNTTTRVGVWQGGTARELSIVTTRAMADAAGGTEVEAIAERAGLARLRVAISSVVPAAEMAWIRWCQERGVPYMVIHGDTPTPLTNRYSEPRRLGPDRLANAVGAVRRLGAPVIVAGLGTATVIDAVTSQREFLGGAIAIGVESGVSALGEMTAALPRITLKAPVPEIGRTTEDCMRLGAVIGAAAFIEGLASRFRSLVGGSAPVALTGGNGALVAEHLAMEHHVFPHLTLEGIGAIWEHNHGGA